MEQLTCCLMFCKRDSITIDKNETTPSNKINTWRLKGLSYISEKTEQSQSQAADGDQSRLKSSSATLDCYLWRKINLHFFLRALILNSPDGLAFCQIIKSYSASLLIFVKITQRHSLWNWVSRIELLKFWFWFVRLIFEGLHEAQFYILLQGFKRATETL